MKKYIASLSVLAVLGAGCMNKMETSLQIPPLPTPEEKTPPTRGFGALPALSSPYAVLGTPEAISARPMAVAVPVPPPMDPTAVMTEPAVTGASSNSSGGGWTVTTADAKLIARPMPTPELAKVTYEVTAKLPTWGSDGDVMRAKATNLPTSGLSNLALASGLPTQALGARPELRSFNINWRDAEGLIWSFDSVGHYLSIWKENQYNVMAAGTDTKIAQPATLSDDEVTAIATDFMTRHGLGTYATGKPTIEHPWNAADGASPCAVVPIKDIRANVEAVSSLSSIAPAPCNYQYPMVTTITYPLLANGQPVYDMSGWPSSGINLQIDLANKEVIGGNIWLAPDTDSSKYPLIAVDKALERLSAGGRNPLYPYGVKGPVRVVLNEASLAWMRYDSWDEQGPHTYFLPAIRATGTQDLGDGKTQPYQTVVPLVADEAFGGTTPPPVMMPMENAVAPSAVSAPAPAVAPKQR